MVDSRNFKKKNDNLSGLKKHKWIPLVVIVILALILIAIQYVMLDILQAVNNPTVSKDAAQMIFTSSWLNWLPKIY